MKATICSALATGALLLLGSNAARADDTVRLGGPTAVVAINDSDTVLARYYGGFHGGYRGHWGGYRGYYGGYRGYSGYRGWGYGGYRGWGYGGYYRPYYYGGFYRPYYYGGYSSYYPYYYGYSPYYYGVYSAPYYYGGYSAPYYGISYGNYTNPYYGIGAGVQLGTSDPSLPSPSNPYVLPAPRATTPQTFPYDGGPANPVPLPGDAGPTSGPPPLPSAGAMLVSQSKGIQGEAGVGFDADTIRLSLNVPAAQPNSNSTTRYSYPAYGEARR
jgi:hypothetical protein